MTAGPRSERPWEAEVEVDMATAKRLVAEQFPELNPLAIEPYGIGWDNIAYRVNGDLIFRFPRRAIAVESIETEAQILPLVAPEVPAPIPVPLFVGVPTLRYQWPFSGYRELAGQTVDRAQLTEAERENLAEPLGAFLKSLHQISGEQARAFPAPKDKLRRLDVPYRASMVRERLERLCRAGALDEPSSIERLVNAAPVGFAPRADVLVHGDLYARHVLVDKSRRLCGIIDWGDVHYGDPAVDLAVVVGMLPKEAQERFVAAYGPVDETRWTVARLRAIHHALALLMYALDQGDSLLEAEARWSLRAIVSGS